MSENKTDETKNPRSFEERVFARFDAVDSRFDAVDSRLDAVDSRLGALENRVEKLESKQYDTKPIWEQALASIAETNQKLAETNERMDRGFELLRNEMKTEFTAVRHEIEHSLRGVDRKIDVLNQNIFNFQVDQRYVDRRLAELEAQIKPT